MIDLAGVSFGGTSVTQSRLSGEGPLLFESRKAIVDVAASERHGDVLGLFDAPAFVVRSGSATWLANEAGTRLLESDGEKTRAKIEGLLGKPPAERRAHDLQVVELRSACGERAFLVVLPSREHVGASELRAAIKRWRLTAREADVVALVAEGEANKGISEKLGVALRTVEVHVASALKKAKVDSRARLIAHFWTRR